MLIESKECEGLHLQARDGSIGTVKDVYFDADTWIIRYLVVDTGSWLKDRKVLVSPVAAHASEWDDKKLPVDLTREQVRNSPGVELDQPVSRQHEALLHEYYGWPHYWTTPAPYPAGTTAAASMAFPVGSSGAREAGDPAGAAVSEEMEMPHGDPHLHSMAEVRGYKIAAVDGAIGHVEEFLIDTQPWRVACLLVNTRNWWPGRTVIVAPEWIREVQWSRREVQVDLSRDTIQRAPEYDASRPVDAEYIARLHEFYRHRFPPRR